MRIRSNRSTLTLVSVFAVLWAGPIDTYSAQSRATNAANFVAEQQAEERYRRLYAIVEDLQAANLMLQQRIERMETQLAKSIQNANDQKADTVTNDQLDLLSNRFTKELQTLENRRAEDNRKILQEIKRIATRPNPVPSPRVVTEKTKPSPPPYTGPVYEITIEPGYTISGIAQKYREQGHEISEEDIIRANPGIDPRRLKIGQVINVPAVP